MGERLNTAEVYVPAIRSIVFISAAICIAFVSTAVSIVWITTTIPYNQLSELGLDCPHVALKRTTPR